MTAISPKSWPVSEVIVVNASPLIFLGNAGRIDLLLALGASRILVPDTVFEAEALVARSSPYAFVSAPCHGRR